MIDVVQKLREIANRSPEEIGRAIAAAEKMSGISQPVAEEKKAKPDYLDFDKDGDKDEPMKKALKDKEEDEDKEDTKESVSEDVQITLSGSDAVLAEILKLAGMIGAKTIKGAEATPSVAPPAPPAPVGMPSSGPIPSLAAMIGGSEPDMGSEPMMDGAYDATTTPNPVTMASSAAIPSGNDLAKPKITTPMTSPGNNPMHTAVSFD